MNRLKIVKLMDTKESVIFTKQQFASLVGKEPEYTSVLLNRLVKDKVITRVMRGRYCLPDSHHLSVASGLYAPSYISLWASLEYHGATTQMPRVIHVINTSHSGKLELELESGSFELSFIQTKPCWIFGMGKIMLDGNPCIMAEKERVIIDGLLFPGRVPIQEIYTALLTGVKKQKLMEYASRVGKQSLLKRVGFLMSFQGMDIKPGVFGKLSDTYVPLDPLKPMRGRYEPNWRIIVNTVMK